MSLDPALFTLHFLPRQASPSITDLSPTIPDAASNSFTPTYTLSRAIRSPKYQNTLLDGLTYTELGSVSASSTGEKCKSLQLFNPDQDNEIRKAGALLRTEWQFAWQGEKLAISKEMAIGVGNGKGSYDVEIVRKPDPPIKIAIYRPESKRTSAFLQIFDYNIDRCEAITDKRGLEHTIILAIASCLDAEYDERHRTPDDNLFLSLVGAAPSADQGALTGMPPAEPLEPNEVVITPLVEPAHIVEHCLNLLKSGMDGADPSGLRAATVGQNLELVVIKAAGEEMAKRAIGIAERVKVGFYRLPDSRKGQLWDGTVPAELYQYVRTSELQAQTGPEKSKPQVPERPTAPPSSGTRPRIKLGGGQSPEPTSTPPLAASPLPARAAAMLSDITIFLSKTKLEEFEAERSQQARLYEEKQSRRLAERLQQEQARNVDSPQSLHAKGQASRRPMSGGQDSPDAARLKPSAHRDARPTSAGGSSGSRNGGNAVQDDPRNAESVSFETSCSSSRLPGGADRDCYDARATEQQGEAQSVRTEGNTGTYDDHLGGEQEFRLPSVRGPSYLDPDFAFRREVNALWPKERTFILPTTEDTTASGCNDESRRAERHVHQSHQASSHDDAFLQRDGSLYEFGSYQKLMRHATWSSRPTYSSRHKASHPAATYHIQREPPRSPLQSSPRDSRPASFLLALQDDSALVKVKTPDAPRRPVVILRPQIPRASSTAALPMGETRLSGLYGQCSQDSQLAVDADSDASEAGLGIDEDPEEVGSLCEAECGSWYGSERSCSSEPASPSPESRCHGIETIGRSAFPRELRQYHSRAGCNTSVSATVSRAISGLPPPILASIQAPESTASHEAIASLPVLDAMKVDPAQQDSKRASAPVKSGRLSRGVSGKKTLSLPAHSDAERRANEAGTRGSTSSAEKSKPGRWSSTPIRELHEQWAADFRGGSGAVSRRKRGKEEEKGKRKKPEARAGKCSPA